MRGGFHGRWPCGDVRISIISVISTSQAAYLFRYLGTASQFSVNCRSIANPDKSDLFLLLDCSEGAQRLMRWLYLRALHNVF